MRLIPATVAVGFASAALLAQSPAGLPGDQSPPTFRAEINVVQLDVSVLDKNRLPVRGLKAPDFRVAENGDAEPVLDVTEIALPDPGQAGAAWLHLVPPDVEANTLADRLDGGQIVVIVFDGAHLPATALATVGRARDIASKIVDRLSGVDVAAVFSTEAGLAEPFTNDPDRLRAAITRYRPHPPILSRAALPPPDLLASAEDVTHAAMSLGRTPCEKADPTVPSLLALTQSLAKIPRRRKTIILISPGDPDPFVRPASGCFGLLAQMASDLFWQAQRANVNIDTFDPSGERAPEAPAGRGRGREVRPAVDPGGLGGPGSAGGTSGDVGAAGGGDGAPARASGNAAGGAPAAGESGGRSRGRPSPASGLTALAVIAESTGGDSVTRTSDFDEPLDRLFEGNRSYYLVSYRTTHPAADGKYRRIAVSVPRSGATVQTRRGYFGPSAESVKASPDSAEALIAAEASLMGVPTGRELALRVSAAAFARPGARAGPGLTAVVVTLGVRTFVPRAPAMDTITVIRTIEDADGVVSAPRRDLLRLALDPDPAVDGRYEISWRIDMPPGRDRIRMSVHSALADRSGTVSTSLDIPDLRQPAVSVSSLVFSQSQAARPVVEWPLDTLLPVAPTTARRFGSGEPVELFCRVYQRGAPRPLAVRLQVLGIGNQVEFDGSQTLASAQFDASGAADYRTEVPTGRLHSGLHLLDLQALLPDGSSARRSVPLVIK